MNLLVQTQSHVLVSYSKKIASIYKNQQLASQATIKAIVEIGNVLIEARDYKDSLKQKNKNELWKKFSTSLSFSPASITKYIKIAEHPVIRLRKNHKFLPPSIHSLYEIAQIDEKKLLKLISTGKITSDIGRSELALLKNNASKSKVLGGLVDEVEVLSIRFPANSWMSDFNDIQNELLSFLEKRQIGFVYGNEFKKIERAETNYQNKIVRKTFQLLKKRIKKLVIEHIDNKGVQLGYWTEQNKPSLSVKVKKLGYRMDEVDITTCQNQDELELMYLSIGLDDKRQFIKASTESLNDAISLVPIPDILENLSSTKPDKSDIELQSNKRRKLNFTGVKV